nr:cysteine desulfurase family protein [uncultured Capnocytophaga sp.]
MKIYFDNAASTPLYPEVIDRMTEVLNNTYGNPSATHAFGRSAKSVIESSRKNIAQQFKAHPSELIFTSGGTEANNFILNGAVRYLNVEVIISSVIEHHSVFNTLKILQKEHSIILEYVKLTEKGEVCLDNLQVLLQKYIGKNILVSLMHINNEIGNILPLKDVVTICKKYNAYFHSDTVQSVGHYPIDLQELPIDFITASAHKFHGPKGVGFAFVRKGIALHSLIAGGQQEKGLRAGTEAVHNIAGMEIAISKSYEHLDKNVFYLKHYKNKFITEIQKNFPDIVLNGNSGELTKGAYTIVNVGFPSFKQRNDTLLFQLDLNGVACSKGSACQSGSVEKSHVLSAFLLAKQLEYPSLRFSFSIFNKEEEIDVFMTILREIALS